MPATASEPLRISNPTTSPWMRRLHGQEKTQMLLCVLDDIERPRQQSGANHEETNAA